MYASTTAGVTPEADGVITIGAGASSRVSAADLSQISTLYLTGSGKVQIVGCYSVHSPFMCKKKGGDGDKNVLAEIPFNGSFDGYGYKITANEQYAIADDEGFHYIPGNGYVTLSFTDERIKDINKIKFSCDCKLGPSNTSNTGSNTLLFGVYMGDAAKYGVSISQYGKSYNYRSAYWSAGGTSYTDYQIRDDDWHHITMTYDLDTCVLSYMIDDDSISPTTLNTAFYNLKFAGTFFVGNNKNAAACEHHIKNLKIEIS